MNRPSRSAGRAELRSRPSPPGCRPRRGRAATTTITRRHSFVTHHIDLGHASRADNGHSAVEAAIAQLANNGAVILTDSPDNPTFGEIVFAASRIDVSATAFTIRHTSGFLQVALPSERCDRLLLPVQRGTDPVSRQCVTVDSSFGIGTGISAADRAHTIRLLADEDSSADSFTRPGHVVPIRADTQDTQSPFGTPDAAIHLATAAGLPPAAAVATIVSVDNPADIAAGAEVRRFAQSHGLPLVGIGDIQRDFKRRLPRPGLRVATPAGAIRFETFAEAGVEYLCVANGDLDGRHNVPLTVLPIDRLFAAAGDSSEPRILVGSPEADRTTRAGIQLLKSIWRPNSALRQLLQGLGCLSVLAQNHS